MICAKSLLISYKSDGLSCGFETFWNIVAVTKYIVFVGWLARSHDEKQDWLSTSKTIPDRVREHWLMDVAGYMGYRGVLPY
jgi:hypothetical protein